MNEICPVYKGMLDPIIASYNIALKVAYKIAAVFTKYHPTRLLMPLNTYNTLLILLTIVF